MTKFYQLSFTLLLTCLSISSHAAVFKCEENGSITFSDKPCTGDAQDITHQQLNQPSPKKTSPATSTSSLAKIKQMAKKMETVRIQRELKRDIESIEDELEVINKAHEKELLVLNKERESIGEADDYDDELTFIELKNNIADKISETNKKHSAEAEEINIKIKALRAKLNVKKQ